jgi:hypothetical protein
MAQGMQPERIAAIVPERVKEATPTVREFSFLLLAVFW